LPMPVNVLPMPVNIVVLTIHGITRGVVERLCRKGFAMLWRTDPAK
jgi:hypothetical protein